MNLASLVVLGALFLCGAMAFAWELTRRSQNGGLADVVWTFGLGGVALIFAVWNLHDGALPFRQYMTAGIIALWTYRLGTGLWRRNVGGAEDARYTEFRKKWGDRFYPRLFWLLIVQALSAILLALAVMLAARNPMPVGLMDNVGIVWMLAALYGGYAADTELAAFKKDSANRGKICDAGLWSRSRHPNYFFEFCFWAGWPMMALSGGWVYGLLALGAPAFIYWLLRYVSGVPMVEELMARRYGQNFDDYCRKVPPFFPRLKS